MSGSLNDAHEAGVRFVERRARRLWNDDAGAITKRHSTGARRSGAVLPCSQFATTVPRHPRLILPGQPLHLIQRGNNRTPVFLAYDEFRSYRELLQVTSAGSGCALHAYVLMTNHVHLLVTPDDVRAVPRLMKRLAQGYARWFNCRHRRTGTLWEGRYRSAVIDSERYLLACSRYIELNPVRARMVSHPEDYEWSSFRANACGADDPLLTPHPCYIALDRTAGERRAAYRALFAEALDEAVLAALRRGTHTRTVAGSTSFVARLEAKELRRLPPAGHGGDRRSATFRAIRPS